MGVWQELAGSRAGPATGKMEALGVRAFTGHVIHAPGFDARCPADLRVGAHGCRWGLDRNSMSAQELRTELQSIRALLAVQSYQRGEGSAVGEGTSSGGVPGRSVPNQGQSRQGAAGPGAANDLRKWAPDGWGASSPSMPHAVDTYPPDDIPPPPRGYLGGWGPTNGGPGRPGAGATANGHPPTHLPFPASAAARDHQDPPSGWRASAELSRPAATTQWWGDANGSGSVKRSEGRPLHSLPPASSGEELRKQHAWPPPGDSPSPATMALPALSAGPSPSPGTGTSAPAPNPDKAPYPPSFHEVRL